MVLDELTLERGARARARRWRTCCRSRPTCSSSRSRPTGPTASACTASRASCTPPPARRSRPRPGARTPGSTGPVAGAQVRVECPDLCPRFTARVFEDVTIAPSPPWLKARLTAAGQRPINNVVDITNYAMLLTGQPLHAFDLDRVAGARADACAARARASRCETLDGQTRTLDGEMVVIEDADGPTSIAGLMGGARSEVAAGHDARAARGRHLERAQHPPHLLGARPAQRGLRALREGPAAGAVHARAGDRHAADDRAVRRERRARHDRRRRRARRRRRRSACARRACRRSSACRSPRERQAEILQRARLRHRSPPPTAST